MDLASLACSPSSRSRSSTVSATRTRWPNTSGRSRRSASRATSRSSQTGIPNTSDATLARVTSHAVHDLLTVADDSDRDGLLDHLRLHERGDTSYLEMSKGMADSGIERWTVDTDAMTMTFYDRSDVALLVEQIT